jgi:dolichol-phosphate mannosyltransferase
VTSNLLLSLVLPTYNEAENVPLLVERLSKLLQGIEYEIIVADDDSPDKTWEVAQGLRQRYPQVRVLRRTSERGLYPAVVEAFSMAQGEILGVMDADLQHDEALLPRMLDALSAEKAALVVASRYCAGGGIDKWSWPRRLISRSGTALAGWALAHPISDPLSGYFLIHRDAFLEMRPRLRPQGFKILLDVAAQLPRASRVAELPYTFRRREHGESKLGWMVMLQAGWTLLGAAVRRFLP